MVRAKLVHELTQDSYYLEKTARFVHARKATGMQQELLGRPLWRPWNPLRFWRVVLGPSMDKIFARVVIRLAASHCS